jgi:hypothetical protein
LRTGKKNIYLKTTADIRHFVFFAHAECALEKLPTQAELALKNLPTHAEHALKNCKRPLSTASAHKDFQI